MEYQLCQKSFPLKSTRMLTDHVKTSVDDLKFENVTPSRITHSSVANPHLTCLQKELIAHLQCLLKHTRGTSERVRPVGVEK